MIRRRTSLEKILENLEKHFAQLEKYQLDRLFLPSTHDQETIYKIRNAGINITGMSSMIYYGWRGYRD